MRTTNLGGIVVSWIQYASEVLLNYTPLHCKLIINQNEKGKSSSKMPLGDYRKIM